MVVLPATFSLELGKDAGHQVRASAMLAGDMKPYRKRPKANLALMPCTLGTILQRLTFRKAQTTSLPPTSFLPTVVI